MVADTAINVTTDLGSGSSAATGLTSVAYTVDSNTITLTSGTDYSFSNGVLTFTSEYIDSLITDNVTAREYKLTFNNTDATLVTINLTYTVPSIAPTLASTTATLSKANGGTLNVNLGSGNLAATDISKLSTVVSGVSHEWAAGTWSYSNGVITLSKTAAIAGVTVGSVRSVEVTFNDTNATKLMVDITIAN